MKRKIESYTIMVLCFVAFFVTMFLEMHDEALFFLSLAFCGVGLTIYEAHINDKID